MPRMRDFHWWGLGAATLYIISIIWSIASIRVDHIDDTEQPTFLGVGVAAFAIGLGLHVVWGIEVNHDKRRHRPWRR